MIYYQNTSVVTKRFYGVEFKPGQIHSVPGVITDKSMIRVDSHVQTVTKKKQVDEVKPSNKEQVATKLTVQVAEPKPEDIDIKQNKEENSNGKDSNK